MLCLSLEGQPAAEVIAGTAEIWLQRLGHITPGRLSAAFDVIEANAMRWPTPAAIREALPTYWPPSELKRPSNVRQIPVDPEQAKRSEARIKAMIEGLAKQLHIEPDGAA